MLGFFKKLFSSQKTLKSDSFQVATKRQGGSSVGERSTPFSEELEEWEPQNIETLERLSAEMPGGDYFPLLESLQNSISKKRYAEAAEAAHRSIAPLRDWLKDPRGDGARLQLRVPALQQGGTMMALTGDLEGLEKIRDLVTEFDHLESYRFDAMRHFKSYELFVAIRKLVSSKPGVLQNKVKAELGEEDGRHVSNLVSWLEKAGEITREKKGKTYALYISEPSTSSSQTQPAETRIYIPAPRTSKADISPDLETFTDRTFRFVAVDVETANRQHSSICQVGLAMVSTSGDVETVGLLIDPEQDFERSNVNLHGIDESSVAGAPNFMAVIQSLRPFLERHLLVQHSNFDKQAFYAASKFHGVPELKANWVDSVKIARRAWPELKGNGGHGLANLKTYLGLSFEHHDAEEDARAAAEVVLAAEAATGSDFFELAKSRNQNYQTSVAIAGNQSGSLYGHVACFTGQLSMSRVEAATIAAGAGITVKTSVSKKVTLLVVGDQDLSTLAGHDKSSKHRRAEDLQSEGHEIKILGESEFLKLIEAE
ncbi:exonuclease domain-containing protein [Ruegeria atlantica]|uniref:exonuclease domain-containing protein n=1 Tax=Ruegeria atlantica TaxID=81569 RepID=UPI0020C4DCC2|nr:exonuclease domain-containing protein [Ruegeria atlantica]